jgi:hypothetical protein
MAPMAANAGPKNINEAVRLLRAAVASHRPEETLILLQLARARLEVAKHYLSKDAPRAWPADVPDH